MRRLILIAMMIAANAALMPACARPGAHGPFRGQVVDAETHQPLEGAVVVVVWYHQPSPLHSLTVPFDAKETVTDKEGRWEVAALPRSGTIFKGGVAPQTWTFMPGGYDFLSVRESARDQATVRPTVTLMRRIKTREERCEILQRPSLFQFEPREKMPRYIATVDREQAILKCGRGAS